MYKIVRFYNQNKKTIWKVILCIALIIGIIQILNYITKKKMGENNMDNLQEQVNNETDTNVYNSVILNDDKTSLTGEEISENKKSDIKYIDEFFEYCNNGKIEDAYNLLTEECKEEMYPEIDAFEQAYCQQIFSGEKKNIKIENWINNIYKVSITDDFLTTGKYNTENTIQDYITVEEDEDYNLRLNINSYIGRKKINKKNEAENIEVNVIERDTYMDYEIYTFEVKNNSEMYILLDDLKNIDTMYIEDGKGVKYSAYTHELGKEQLLLSPNETRKMKIKYYSKYGSTKTIEKVIFSKIILNYDNYNNMQNKAYYKNYLKLAIDI